MQRIANSTADVQQMTQNDQRLARPSGASGRTSTTPGSLPASAGAPAAARDDELERLRHGNDYFRRQMGPLLACEALAATVDEHVVELLTAADLLSAIRRPLLASALNAIAKAHKHNEVYRAIRDLGDIKGEVPRCSR